MEAGHNDEILNLLTIDSRPGSITLIFAGDAAVHLEVEAIRCHLEDIGQPWPTRWRPHHDRSEEHTSELQSLMRISYAVFCLKKKKNRKIPNSHNPHKIHKLTNKHK